MRKAPDSVGDTLTEKPRSTVHYIKSFEASTKREWSRLNEDGESSNIVGLKRRLSVVRGRRCYCSGSLRSVSTHPSSLISRRI